VHNAAALFERHPVSHDRPIPGSMPQASADRRLGLSGFGPNQEALAIRESDTRGLKACFANMGKFTFKMGIPAKPFQGHCCAFLHT